MSKRISFLAGAALTLLTVAGCSSGESSVASDQSVVTAGDSDNFNDDDVMFAQMMIPHHEQAIELSDMALDPTIGAGEEVRDLALRIKQAQDPEIATMKNLLSMWGESLEMDSSMDHSDMMTGMLSSEELSSLSTLRGGEFDRAWMEAMIAHHEGAIEMALDVMLKGVNQGTKTLADAIVTGQETEIEELNRLLAQLS